MPQITIQLPDNFTSQHENLVRRYLTDNLQGQADWRLVGEIFDLLDHAIISGIGFSYTFRSFYRRFVDEQLANDYLHSLLALQDVKTQSAALWAKFARKIVDDFTQLGWNSDNPAATRLLLSYLLYWWNAFARGYAFEVEIFQELQKSSIDFRSHNLLDPTERFSPSDLIVSDQTGDIKTSTYFLRTVFPGQHDFYIVRFVNQGRIYPIVVLLHPAAWDKINGDTINGDLATVLQQLPTPVRIRPGKHEFVVIQFEEWKRRILRIQGARS